MPDAQKYTNKLVGARVLVIGGSSGLGFAAAEASLESGATVIISSSNPSRVETGIARLQKDYPSAASRVSGHACNLGEAASIEKNVKALLEAATDSGKNKLDHILYTAGDALAMMAIGDADIEKIQKAGNVRFFGPLLVAKHAPQYMNPGPASSIVLTTGSVSERPRPNWAIVGSFATGLQGMCRGLALDLAPLRVNLVSPGAVDTELWDGMDKEKKAAMFKALEANVPVGRVATAGDVAELYLYFMKDKNVTGVMCSSNGGVMLK